MRFPQASGAVTASSFESALNGSPKAFEPEQHYASIENEAASRTLTNMGQVQLRRVLLGELQTMQARDFGDSCADDRSLKPSRENNDMDMIEEDKVRRAALAGAPANADGLQLTERESEELLLELEQELYAELNKRLQEEGNT